MKIKDLTLSQVIEMCSKADAAGTCRACPLSYFFGRCMFDADSNLPKASGGWNLEMLEKEIGYYGPNTDVLILDEFVADPELDKLLQENGVNLPKKHITWGNENETR